MRKAPIIILILTAVAIYQGCTDEKTIIQSPRGVRISGVIKAWYCDVCDPVNNISTEPRYTVNTGIPAEVKFVRLNGLSFEGYTDDSSEYSWVLDEGAYMAVVVTPHAHPDTFFNIYLRADTTIDFNIVYEYLTADTIEVDFFPWDVDNALALDSAWEYLRTLNGFLDGILKLSGSRRILSQIPEFHDDVTYRIPIGSGVPPWKVNDMIKAIQRRYTIYLPAQMYAYPDYYVCMQD